MSALRSILGGYARSRIRRGLEGVWVRDLDAVLGAGQARPVVLAATHAAWWDGLLLLPLDDALGRRGRVWLDPEHLVHPSFGPLGAVPLDTSGTAGLLRSVRAATDWLAEPGRQLWVFPQGRRQPSWARPLELHPGASWLARRAGAALVPVAIAYGFRDAALPAAVVSFGEPVHPDHLEAGLLQELRATDRFLTCGDPSFERLVGGREHGERRGFAARALSGATARA